MTANADVQWPRYQVFHQQAPDRPHTNAGSVHAADPEIALQNARDVFVRRPECSSLWVVPAGHIASLTAEQLQRTGLQDPAGSSDRSEPYLVFEKRTHIGSHEHAGEVQARSPEEALRAAVAASGERPVLVWWVAPKRLMAATEDDQRDSLFGPARSKDYRGQAAYPTTTMMREVRQRATDPE